MKTLFYSKTYLAVIICLIVPVNLAYGQEAVTSQLNESQDGTKPWAGVQGFEVTFPAMGTLVHLVTYSEDADRVETAFQAVQEKVNQLSNILTDYDPLSESRQLPLLASREATAVSPALWDVLVAADSWYHQTQGALDCSLGALTHLWRKYRRVDRVPDKELVDQAVQNVGWSNIQLDPSRQAVSMTHDRIRLDFGAIGKGYVIDRVFDLLCDYGLESSLVNVSGDMRVGSPPPGRDVWRVAIASISQRDEPAQTLTLKNMAIATSGDLWQFQMIEGEKRSHILDPATGYGVLGPMAVTVIAPSALDADALATAGCVMQWEKFKQLVESQTDTQAMKIVNSQGHFQRKSTIGFPDVQIEISQTHETNETGEGKPE